MGKGGRGKPPTVVSKRVGRASAVLASLADGIRGFTSMTSDAIHGFMHALVDMTGYVSESVVTSIAMAAASDVIQDIFAKRWAGTPEEQQTFHQKARLASDHLSRAGQIIDGLQEELSQRNEELEGLLGEIELRQADAAHWRQIASASRHVGSALMEEIERRVRAQIRAELDKGKGRRRVFAAIRWTVTLLLGGVVGAVIQHYWQTGLRAP